MAVFGRRLAKPRRGAPSGRRRRRKPRWRQAFEQYALRPRAGKWPPHATHTRWWSADGLSLRNGVVGLRWWLASAHRRATERQTVRVLNEAIEDGIRQCGITPSQSRMPGFNWQLADHQSRTHLAAIVDDLQQTLGLDDPGWGQE